MFNLEFHQKNYSGDPNSRQLMEGTIWLTDFHILLTKGRTAQQTAIHFKDQIIKQPFVLRTSGTLTPLKKYSHILTLFFYKTWLPHYTSKS